MGGCFAPTLKAFAASQSNPVCMFLAPAVHGYLQLPERFRRIQFPQNWTVWTGAVLRLEITPMTDLNPQEYHDRFLTLLPRLRGHARVYFRFVRCPQRKDDLTAEAIALAWSWYVKLVQRGMDPHAFKATLVHRALQQARAHRALCGQAGGKDALSPVAQRRHNFLAQAWPEFDIADPKNPLTSALVDNTRTRPDVQAMFRIDFSGWLASLPRRHQALAIDLLRGEKLSAVAQKYNRSCARISQLRRELRQSWEEYNSDQVETFA